MAEEPRQRGKSRQELQDAGLSEFSCSAGLLFKAQNTGQDVNISRAHWLPVSGVPGVFPLLHSHPAPEGF